ncbi:hypothetical protein DZF91_38345 [Actinomadura logoneensis]|uniref:Glycosyl transferase n=1 Tax=Actinomadura logoneensis TaxID=2293572 RepID=A0A372JAJ5_9ACTN|nr:hypothetical protein [Actinomadura logoneensis]RFU36408.1 hypothetical protein DZF91_38345 [Actinomadura logoneensis]
MIACYARGAGFGHLTRVRAALHTLGREGEPVTLVSDSPFAARLVPEWPVVPSLSGVDADEVWIDAFPAGIHGELRVPDGRFRVVHLARLLRWPVYERLLPAVPPRIDTTYICEPLTRAQEEYLRSVSGEVTTLELVDPPATADEDADADAVGWLVVHSGPDEEIRELVAYAADMAAAEGVRPRFTLVAPRVPDGLLVPVVHRDVHPAWPLGAHADRIVTAGGFNAVRQFAPWRERHRIMPFPRRLDDQFARAARVRAEAAG